MEKIPTAKEFIEKQLEDFIFVNKLSEQEVVEIANAVIEFTKLHRKAILEAAAGKLQAKVEIGLDAYISHYRVESKDDIILYAYPEELIK